MARIGQTALEDAFKRRCDFSICAEHQVPDGGDAKLREHSAVVSRHSRKVTAAPLMSLPISNLAATITYRPASRGVTQIAAPGCLDAER